MEDLGLERGAQPDEVPLRPPLSLFLGPTKKYASLCTGRLHSIDTFTAVDGHGIRAIIFLQGESKPSVFHQPLITLFPLLKDVRNGASSVATQTVGAPRVGPT